MAEATECTSTMKLAIMKELVQIPNDQRAAALRLAAEVMAEQTGQALPNNADEQAQLNVISRPIPRPFSIATPLPMEVRTILREATILFVPHSFSAPSRETTQLTVEEKEDRERNVNLKGNIKVPKFVHHPYSLFYPHMWENKTFEEWFLQWTSLITGHPVPDVHILKVRRLEGAMRSWFSLFSKKPLDADSVQMFFCIVDILGEVFLLLKYTGPRPSIATLTFSAALEARRHSGKAYDYFADLNTARSAVELPKNGMFRL